MKPGRNPEHAPGTRITRRAQGACHLRTVMQGLPWAVPLSAHAEPAASMGHLPYLWLLTIGIAVGITWSAMRVLGRRRLRQKPVWRWIIAAVLFAVLLILISPVIVGIGSILITGRTM